jgi:hypothetical protein
VRVQIEAEIVGGDQVAERDGAGNVEVGGRKGVVLVDGLKGGENQE